jgi:hypothetical protein
MFRVSVLAFASTLLMAHPAHSAVDANYCRLWAREYLRIELDRFRSSVTTDQLVRALERYTSRCVQSDARPILPDRPESSNAAWIKWMVSSYANATEPPPGTVPATGGPVEATDPVAANPGGSDGGKEAAKKTAFNSWCARHFRSFNISDGTVVRRGSRTRIACPYPLAR